MDVAGIIDFIVNQGFAVAVAVYSLTRLERTMRENTSVLQALVSKMDGGQ
jgi:hypothetical protein